VFVNVHSPSGGIGTVDFDLSFGDGQKNTADKLEIGLIYETLNSYCAIVNPTSHGCVAIFLLLVMMPCLVLPNNIIA
jgi:hypothetical protein